MIRLRKLLGQIGVAVAGGSMAAPALALGLLVPGYFYTDHEQEWQSLIDVAARQPLSVVFNPDNGAGRALDPNFVTAIDALRAAGGKAYAYVGTRSGTRRSIDVEAEIEKYLDWYTFDGFFIDEVSEHALRVDYYKDVKAFVASKGPNLDLIGNPGTPPDEEYLEAFDTLVIYEDSAANLARYDPPDYLSQYDESRFAMLVHGASEADAISLIDKAEAANVGFIYATDTPFGAELWLELPSYWEAQAEAIASAQGPLSPIPEPSAALMMIGGLVTIASLARRRRQPA